MHTYKEKVEYAEMELISHNVDIHYIDKTTIKFMHKGYEVLFYPYKGWFTGKSVNNGRGLKNLLGQLK